MLKEKSSVLHKKKPSKIKDPGNFSISCMISETEFDNALCDLDARVNIMLYSLFKKLNIKEVKLMTISMQLADHSIVHPKAITEYVLIKIKHFIFRGDFTVLDMEEDGGIPLILGVIVS